MIKHITTISLVFWLIPNICHGQDCGYLKFEVDYISYPVDYRLNARLLDRCSLFYLVMNHNLSTDKLVSIDTFIIDNSEVKAFLRRLEHTDVDKLNSLSNSYLNDGLTINYTYVSRQEYIVSESLRLPVANIESLIYIEEELLLLKEYSELFFEYLTAEQLMLYTTFVKSMIYEAD